jgi:hypothetical protein
MGQGFRQGDPGIRSLYVHEQKLSCATRALDLVTDRRESTVRDTSRTLLCWLSIPKLPADCELHSVSWWRRAAKLDIGYLRNARFRASGDKGKMENKDHADTWFTRL